MSDFLYPFLEPGSSPEVDTSEVDTSLVDALLVDLAASARDKATASNALVVRTLGDQEVRLAEVATVMVERFARGGRMFTFGNGGSSTDAASMAVLFASPPSGAPLSARPLVTDSAVLTALANDVGFELVYSRQLIAHAERGDIAVGFSTSGNSRNLLCAFGEARRRGLMTIGFAGYDGGDMRRCGDVEHCFVVASDSVHRVQETHGALAFALWSAVQHRLVVVGGGGG
jgi:D-sedoheptulose 7-phosphate isomerase